MPNSRSRSVAVATALAAVLAVVAAGCSQNDAASTPPAAAVSLGPTSTTVSPDDPPVVIGGAPGTDGHLPVRLNPKAWEEIAMTYVDDDPEDPYYEFHSEGHDNFWFGVELHTETGPGWTGELGLSATDCASNGICVRFDPDGGAGPTGPILAGPRGEIDIEQLGDDLVVGFRNLVFVRDDGTSYRIDAVTVDTT